MAECSYARCLQEKRQIKRELLKWSKDMVQVVGLERIAEELMGRRKWELFQKNLSRSQLNTNLDHINLEHKYIENLEPSIAENHISEKLDYPIKNEFKYNCNSDIRIKKEFDITDNSKTSSKQIKKEPSNDSSSIISLKSALSIPTLGLIDNQFKPFDWKPSDKCYFCIDGKLLTVNEKGELVAESGSAQSETELANRSTAETDSGESRNSTPDILRSQSLIKVKKIYSSQQQQEEEEQQQQQQQQQQQHLKESQYQSPPKMTSFESMARLAAVASIHPALQPGLNQLNQMSQLGQMSVQNLYLQQLAQMFPPAAMLETPLPAISPTNKDSPSPLEGTSSGNGEQPLDLSAKPPDAKESPSRSKQRATPTSSGRRSYSEEELQKALQDIMSGKLGTRKAAAVYHIPRSTLRNKVYKMASEQKRETSTPSSINLYDVDDDDNDNDTDKIGVFDDDNSNDKVLESPLLSDQEHYSDVLQKNRQLNNTSGNGSGSSDDHTKLSTPLESLTSPATTPTIPLTQNKVLTPQPSQTPPVGTNWLDPNLLLQTLLLANQANLCPSNTENQAALRELLNVLKMQQEEIIKKLSNNSNSQDNLNHQKQMMDSIQIMQNIKQHEQQLGPLNQHLHHTTRLPKSDTPETGSSVDINEINEDGVILKIPSFKPVVVPASSSSTTSSIQSCDQNQISPSSSSASVHHSVPSLLSRSPHQQNNLQGLSPPLMRQNSESQSPPGVSVREYFTNSLNRFSQQSNKDNNMNKTSHLYNDLNEQYGKRASISVIKNIGGTDISKFATTPNLLNNYQNSANQCAAGKGTRPKRGKYRNYDRDSLTEAVKAVQRGEMSVHRAGSYYGVPHSTLEYKVKERHLMRPRKREPKPQPLDSSSGSGSTNVSNPKHPNIPGLTAVNNLEKLKASATQQQKTALKPNQSTAFPSTSPNGMKVPIFDTNLSAQLQYGPALFWQHPAAAAAAAAAAGFNPLPMEFPSPGRTASTGPGNGSSGNSTATSPAQQQPNPFSPNTDFLATQMIQRFHEESRLNAANANNSNNKSPSLAGNNNNNLNNNNSDNVNNNNNNNNNNSNNNNSSSNVPLAACEIAQSLYGNNSANGSFLDGIIRKSLDRKSNNSIPHGALFDQLMKNTKPPAIPGSSSTSTSEMHSQALVNALTNNKRPGSPNTFPMINIKRERSNSPQSSMVPISLQTTSTTTSPGSGLIGNITNNLLRSNDLNHPSNKRNSLNDDNEISLKLMKDTAATADSLIKARLEGLLIKTESNDNQHHTIDLINQPQHQQQQQQHQQQHHTKTSSNSIIGGSDISNISHLHLIEDLNGKKNGDNSRQSDDDNDLINKDIRNSSSGSSTAIPSGVIRSDDLILKNKLGLIKSESDENL